MAKSHTMLNTDSLIVPCLITTLDNISQSRDSLAMTHEHPRPGWIQTRVFEFPNDNLKGIRLFKYLPKITIFFLFFFEINPCKKTETLEKGPRVKTI